MSQLRLLMDAADTASAHARALHSDVAFRRVLRDRNPPLMTFKGQISRLPHLIEQELAAYNLMLSALPRLLQLGAQGDPARKEVADEFAEPRFTLTLQLVLSEYAQKERRAELAVSGSGGYQGGDASSLEVESDAMMPVLINVLTALESANDGYLRRNMAWILPSLCDLIRCRRPEVRAGLHRIMMTKMSPVLVHGDVLGS
uniref:Sec7/BIG1-like C-terminal domain-containing protein n=1 Tax=Florenciella parvula TaxID=236787 RepID=A0A7S2FRD0_9STRA